MEYLQEQGGIDSDEDMIGQSTPNGGCDAGQSIASLGTGGL
jgi:hypothetical protein